MSLDAALETALLRELLATWRRIDRDKFGSSMRAPRLELSDSERQLGRWQPAGRSLALSRRLLLEHTWGEVVAVLEHEMAHQYVTEVLGITDESAHGPAFREVCAERDIDARAGGRPMGDEPAPAVIRRVRGLLALAESPNPHEAEAAARAAHRLMRRHNIAAAEASERRYGFRQVGPAKARFDAWEKRLADILARHFFVEAIWVPVWIPTRGRRGRVLELCGAPENLELAAWVHAYLTETGERLWRDHRKRRRIRSDRDRRTFLQGVMSGFDGKLAEEAEACRQEGLVWIGDAGLKRFVRRRFHSLRRTRVSVRRADDAWLSGREAGRRIQLRRPVEVRPSKRGRLLE